jgi:hypothetical protein
MKTLHSIRQLQAKKKGRKKSFFRFFWEVKARTLLSCHYSKGECFISLSETCWRSGLTMCQVFFRDISSLVGMLDGLFDLPKKGHYHHCLCTFLALDLPSFNSFSVSFFLQLCVLSMKQYRNNISKNPRAICRALGVLATHNGRSTNN